MKVLVSDNMSEKGIDLFQKGQRDYVDVKTGLAAGRTESHYQRL